MVEFCKQILKDITILCLRFSIVVAFDHVSFIGLKPAQCSHSCFESALFSYKYMLLNMCPLSSLLVEFTVKEIHMISGNLCFCYAIFTANSLALAHVWLTLNL